MNTETVDRGDDVGVLDDAPITEATEATEVPAPAEEAVVEPEVTKLGKDDDKSGWIPKKRFDEAVSKERGKTELANKQLEELRDKEQVKTVSEDITQAQAWVKEMVRKRNSLLADGDLDKASEIDDKIFEVQDAIADRRAEMRASNAKESAKSEIQYDAVVARMEDMYPQINPDSDDYDEEAVTELRALMRGYQQEMKLSAAKALERATKRIFGEVRKADTDAVTEVGLRRKAEAVQRNTEAAGRQPPKMAAGLDHDKKGGGMDAKTVMKLDYKEFSKLNEETLAKLRGDEL